MIPRRLRNRVVSFNHLIGTYQQDGQHFEAKRFGGLEIDDEFAIRQLLDGEIGKLATLEKPVSVDTNLASPSNANHFVSKARFIDIICNLFYLIISPV